MKLNDREKDFLIVLAVFMALAMLVMAIARAFMTPVVHAPQITFGNSVEELFDVTDGDYVAFPTNDNSGHKYTIVNIRDGREYSSDDASGAWMVPVQNTDGSWSYNIKWLNHLDQVNRKYTICPLSSGHFCGSNS